MSIEAVKLICDEHGIKHSVEGESRRGFYIHIPKGRNVSLLSVNDEAADKILACAPDFFKYKFVEGYDALWSPENGTLECEIQLPNGRFPLQRFSRQNSDADNNGALLIPSYKEGVSIEISSPSNVFTLCTLLRDQFPRTLRNFERIKDYSATIKISGLDINQHDQALYLVEKICSAICFQIDCKIEQPVMLSFERKIRSLRKRTKFLDEIEFTPVQFTYDNEALSLYWYAQTAFGMPLLKYLALYQVVEFYYPIYSEMAAQNKIRNVLKDPNFNANNDKDLAKVMHIIKFNSSSGAFGNELSQLKATIAECVDIQSLRAWLTLEQERDDYFRSKNAKKLSGHVINSSVEDDALLEQVVLRFYNIRCRIVHTKGVDGNFDVLHPQAKELAYIDHDIDLANFIAHKVMIASSQPLITKP
ncbi:hypothetical protein IM880_04260 [Pectobacterium polaris]|uniref:Apea-like HEPN domain-containing protein n=1 Tax=Pectobacterium polaris TaxID=2042057 RepID=A0AAW4NW85_9GAMM|nr:hypothetical protein [Pectobacterium polaris]MBW5891413.1 hypothetical protein [Pectobacterium polaris]